jgi:hypothetical protein
VGTAEAGQQGRQIDHCESLDCADVQLAAQDAADTGHGIPVLVGCDQRATGRRQQSAARLGKHHAPAVAHEQRCAHLAFERLDRKGSEPPELLLGLQDRFDTHFLDSPAWQRARGTG